MHRETASAPSPPLPESELIARLRRQILLRDSLRPGTPRHWRAACEVRALQRLVVQESLEAASGSRR
jgi:hypothetical protein